MREREERQAEREWRKQEEYEKKGRNIEKEQCRRGSVLDMKSFDT